MTDPPSVAEWCAARERLERLYQFPLGEYRALALTVIRRVPESIEATVARNLIALLNELEKE